MKVWTGTFTTCDGEITDVEIEADPEKIAKYFQGQMYRFRQKLIDGKAVKTTKMDRAIVVRMSNRKKTLTEQQ